MACVLVTGAAGFIGSHLTEALAAQGHCVRCLTRRPGQLRSLRLRGVSCISGDLASASAAANAIEGAQVVYHVAGRLLAMNRREFRRDNVLGTATLARACATAPRPPVFIYVSSLAAAGPAPAGRPRIESDPARPVSDYGKSKLAAELVLQTLADRLPTTIIRPPVVFGPGDRYTLLLYRSVLWGWNVIPACPGQRLSLVHVGDLVQCLIRAAVNGERLKAPAENAGAEHGIYSVAQSQAVTLAEFGELVAAALHVKAPRTVRVPCAMCRVTGLVSDWLALLLGRPVYLGSDKMREAEAGSWTCSSQRAERDLGYRPHQDLLTQLKETGRWYREHGWL